MIGSSVNGSGKSYSVNSRAETTADTMSVKTPLTNKVMQELPPLINKNTLNSRGGELKTIHETHAPLVGKRNPGTSA